MISNEIRNRIEAKCDIHESNIIAGIKKGKNTRIEQGEAPALREAYGLNEH